MAGGDTDDSIETADSLAERRTRLAEMRNRMAAERTLMGWMRTSVSLITFGFSISQFFEYLSKLEPERAAGRTIKEPFFLGLVLVGVGTFALIVALAENYSVVNALIKRQPPLISRWSIGSVSAIVVILIGFVLIVVLVRSL